MSHTRVRELLTLIFFFCCLTGCGDGSSDDSSTSVDLSSLMTWAVPDNVTELHLIGSAGNGTPLFEQFVPTSAAATISVPALTHSLQVIYLAEGVQVGVAHFDLELQPGQPFQFEIPGSSTPTYQLLKRDILINADLWELEPRMIAAGLGFTEIIGVPGIDIEQSDQSEALVRAVGGTWNSVACEDPSLGAFTSAVSPQQIAATYGVPVVNNDGLPVEFSWPIRPSTLDPTDFRVTLNDGRAVIPNAASITPNYDFNERAVAVLFGKFGNRFSPADPRARYPIKVEVIADETPLELIGPGGQPVSAVGMFSETGGSPYTDPDIHPSERGGPRLVGAKLTRISDAGDGAPLFLSALTPNDGVALYGKRAEYRLRVLTSGGFSPDGVRGIFPTEYSRYFRVHATSSTGEKVLLSEAGVRYEIDGGTVEVVGLAELGLSSSSYDECYSEDQDNQIDIILQGDESAVRKITDVEVPSIAPHLPLYNPGGPGNQPTPGVRYSAPSPPHLQPVVQAIDDPMTVTYIDLRGIPGGQ